MTTTLEPTAAGLHSPGSDVPIGPYLRRLWELRHYAVAISKAKVEAQTSDTALGRLWLIGEPLVFIGVYAVIFGWVLDVDRGVDNFVGYLAVGRILFRHNRQGIIQASNSTIAFESEIQTMAVPRALFPLASVIGVSISFTSAAGVMTVMLLATGEVPSLAWLWLAPVLVGQILLNAGLGLIMARLVAQFRDIAQPMPYLFRFAIYASGVVFSIRAFIEAKPNGDLYMKLIAAFNPLYDYIHLGRWALMGIEPAAPAWVIVGAIVWPIVTIVFGMWFFRTAELRYGFGQIGNAP